MAELRSGEALAKEIDGSLPGELRGGLIVAGRRIVVEAVLRPWILMHFVLDLRFLERGLERGPAGVDALILAGVVNEQRGFYFGNVFARGLAAVKGHGRTQVRQSCGKHVGDRPAVAEADGRYFAVGFRKTFQEICRSDEIVAGLVLVELGEELACLVLVARITAQWKQRIGREGDEVFGCDAA